MTKRIIAFPYYGGKNSHLGWLLPLLPYTDRYVEPFGGSAAVLMNRDRSPVEVYNDIDNDVVNFFRVLREQHDELIDLLHLTPYSKTEFHNAHEPTDDPLERARRFFTEIRQSFLGKRREGKSQTWALGLQLDSTFSKAANRWLGSIEKLKAVAIRFMGVHIECRPANYIIKAYDDPNSFQYLDPPYIPESRVSHGDFRYEMTKEEHKELLELVLSCESKFAISSYDNSLYNEMLKDWFRFEDKLKGLAGPRGKRQEILYTNYDTQTVVSQDQTQIDDFFNVFTNQEVTSK